MTASEVELTVSCVQHRNTFWTDDTMQLTLQLNSMLH